MTMLQRTIVLHDGHNPLDHLHSLEHLRHRAAGYLAQARTPQERAYRQVRLDSLDREIAAERQFLGLSAEEPLPDMTDDELLAALLS